jgi:DNA-binding NtrC family response regulator
MKKKILIVEDNNDSRAILILMLTNMGYQAIGAQQQQRGNCVR